MLESHRILIGRFSILLDIVFIALLISTGSCGMTEAQTGGNKDRAMTKLAPELTALYDEYSRYLASHAGGVFRSDDPTVRMIDDLVVIDAVASADVDVLKSNLVSLGGKDAVAFGRIVSGQLPISAIPAMAALPSLQFARAAAGLTHGDKPPLSPGARGQ